MATEYNDGFTQEEWAKAHSGNPQANPEGTKEQLLQAISPATTPATREGNGLGLVPHPYETSETYPLEWNDSTKKLLSQTIGSTQSNSESSENGNEGQGAPAASSPAVPSMNNVAPQGSIPQQVSIPQQDTEGYLNDLLDNKKLTGSQWLQEVQKHRNLTYGDIIKAGQNGRMYRSPEQIAADEKRARLANVFSNVGNVLTNLVNYARVNNGGYNADLSKVGNATESLYPTIEARQQTKDANDYKNYMDAFVRDQANADNARRYQLQLAQMMEARKKAEADATAKRLALAETQRHNLASEGLTGQQRRTTEEHFDATESLAQARLAQDAAYQNGMLELRKKSKDIASGRSTTKGKSEKRYYYISRNGGGRVYIPSVTDRGNLINMAKAVGANYEDKDTGQTIQSSIISRLRGKHNKNIKTEDVPKSGLTSHGNGSGKKSSERKTIKGF